MPIELHENQARVTLNTIRRFYRRNSRLTLYKLIQKTHPGEMAWVFRYLNSAERRDVFQYIRRMEGLSSFLNEIDHAIVPDIFNDFTTEETASIFPIILEKLNIDPAISTGPFVTTFIDIIGVSCYFFIATSLLS